MKIITNINKVINIMTNNIHIHALYLSRAPKNVVKHYSAHKSSESLYNELIEKHQMKQALSKKAAESKTPTQFAKWFHIVIKTKIV